MGFFSLYLSLLLIDVLHGLVGSGSCMIASNLVMHRPSSCTLLLWTCEVLGMELDCKGIQCLNVVHVESWSLGTLGSMSCNWLNYRVIFIIFNCNCQTADYWLVGDQWPHTAILKLWHKKDNLHIIPYLITHKTCSVSYVMMVDLWLGHERYISFHTSHKLSILF